MASDRPTEYPLLLLGAPIRVARESLAAGPVSGPRPRSGRDQGTRLDPRWEALQTAMRQQTAALTPDLAGNDPELVLVFEVAGSVDGFFRAVSRTPGCEFLADIDEDDFDDGLFRNEDDPRFGGSLYMVSTNQAALSETLALWDRFKADDAVPFPWGLAPWKEVFRLLSDVRRWSPDDRVNRTGLVFDLERKLSQGQDPIKIEVELWYRSSEARRSAAENSVRAAVIESGGMVLDAAVIDAISYHALLVQLPRAAAESVVQRAWDALAVARSSEVSFLRPEAQAISAPREPAEPENLEASIGRADAEPGAPLVGVLDGLPVAQHEFLSDRVIVDDPDGWEAEVPAADRLHGTAIASLVLHDDCKNADAQTLGRRIYLRPVLRPDPNMPGVECTPGDRLTVDFVHSAVVRLYEGTPLGACPSIRLINLSIGDTSTQLGAIFSPWARLLDYLAHRYHLLFVVSAGNHTRSITLPQPKDIFSKLTPDEIRSLTWDALVAIAQDCRILSPAESFNSLAVGALHEDASGAPVNDSRVDLFPAVPNSLSLPGTYGARGMGYRRAIKPDLCLPGGRLLYRASPLSAGKPVTVFEPSNSDLAPGLAVATPSPLAGKLSGIRYFRGTSGAAAVASHYGGLILENLASMSKSGAAIPDRYLAVLTKALLVHCAYLPDSVAELVSHLPSATGDRARDAISRFYGYGSVDPTTVLNGAATRATAVAWGTLQDGEGDRYEFPLPPSLSGTPVNRVVTITLAYFSPLTLRDRRQRAMETYFIPDKDALAVSRLDQAWRTVRKGTVQHERLGGSTATAFIDGDAMKVQVNCRAITNVKSDVSYGLAVSIATLADLPIWNEVAARLTARARVRA